MFVGLRKPGGSPAILWLAAFNLPRILVVAPSALAVRLRFRAVASIVHKRPELAARHLIFTQIKVMRQLYSMLYFVNAPPLLARRRAHLESACWNPDELDLDAIAKIQHEYSASAATCRSVLVIPEGLFSLARL